MLLFSFWTQKTHRAHLIGWHRVTIAFSKNVVVLTRNRNNQIFLPDTNKLIIWLWRFCLGHDKKSFFFFWELYVNLLEELCLQFNYVCIGSNTKEDRSYQLDEKMTKWDWSTLDVECWTLEANNKMMTGKTVGFFWRFCTYCLFPWSKKMDNKIKGCDLNCHSPC